MVKQSRFEKQLNTLNQQMVQMGQITPQTYVWKQGMAQWELAGNVQELASLFFVPSPPPVPGGMPTPPMP